LERDVTLFSGVCITKRDVTLPRLVPNQMSRERVEGRGGGGEIAVFFREGSNVAQSVRAQLGARGGARNRGASKRSRIGMWSEPVEKRGSDHSVK